MQCQKLQVLLNTFIIARHFCSGCASNYWSEWFRSPKYIAQRLFSWLNMYNKRCLNRAQMEDSGWCSIKHSYGSFGMRLETVLCFLFSYYLWKISSVGQRMLHSRERSQQFTSALFFNFRCRGPSFIQNAISGLQYSFRECWSSLDRRELKAAQTSLLFVICFFIVLMRSLKYIFDPFKFINNVQKKKKKKKNSKLGNRGFGRIRPCPWGLFKCENYGLYLFFLKLKVQFKMIDSID